MYPRYSQSNASSGRRVAPSDRLSASGVEYSPSYDPAYNRGAREGYVPARAGGVIPISTETYMNGVPVRSSRISPIYDSYNDRISRPLYNESINAPRRSVTAQSSSSPASRLVPAIIHEPVDRQSTSIPRSAEIYDRDRDYYTIPASSNPSREHKKVYSIDDSRTSRNMREADRDDSDRDITNRPRRDSFDRRGYHLSGPRTRPIGVDNSSGYEYTDPRGMYNDTEPRYRVRGGSVGMDRPSSMYEQYDLPKNITREPGPPPATRGLDKIKGRVEDIHDPVRSPPRNRNREYYSQDDTYNLPPRMPLPRRERPQQVERDDDYRAQRDFDRGRDEYDDRLESRAPIRLYEDRDVATRGFGLRTSSVDAFAPHEHGRESISIDPLERETVRREVVEPRVDMKSDNSREFDRPKDRDRVPIRERERDDTRYPDREVFRDRDPIREPERNLESDRRHRARDVEREPERPRHLEEDRVPPEEEPDTPKIKEPRDRPRDDVKPREDHNLLTGMAAVGTATAAAAAAAYGVHEHNEKKTRERPPPTVEDDPSEPSTRAKDVAEDLSDRPDRNTSSPEANIVRERHYVKKEEPILRDESNRDKPESEILDPDEDYRRRMQQEVEKLKRSQPAARQVDDDLESDRRRRDSRARDQSGPREEPPRDFRPGRDNREDQEDDVQRDVGHQHDRRDSILDAAIVDEPVDIPESSDNRVRIVEPPKDKAPPKSILRKPTEKFPDYPNATREGVAPLKDPKKADIPEGAKWTKVSRDLINPAALEEGNERFEERRDVVIVLRVLTKEEVQEYADRTREIRLEREHHRDRRDRRHRRRRDGGDENSNDNDDDSR